MNNNIINLVNRKLVNDTGLDIKVDPDKVIRVNGHKYFEFPVMMISPKSLGIFSVLAKNVDLVISVIQEENIDRVIFDYSFRFDFNNNHHHSFKIANHCTYDELEERFIHEFTI